MRVRVLVVLLFSTILVGSARADPLPTATPESVGLSSARLARLAQPTRHDMLRHTAGVTYGNRGAGEFLWSGAEGTMFWVDPKEEMAVVFLANTPGAIRRHYRELVKTLVAQAIAD